MDFTRSSTQSDVSYDAGLRSHMTSVYNIMAAGLTLSAFVAAAITWTDFGHLFFAMTRRGLSPTPLGWIGMLGPLGMLIAAMFMNTSRWSLGGLRTFYWVFTALEGVGLATVFMTHGAVDITRALFATAAAFAGLSIWGYSTGRNLSGVGSFCMMGLFGMIAVALIGAVTGFTVPSALMGVVGVLVFSGLTAWDTQRIKTDYLRMGDDGGRAAVWSALSLYLDAMNMFRIILNLLSSRN